MSAGYGDYKNSSGRIYAIVVRFNLERFSLCTRNIPVFSVSWLFYLSITESDGLSMQR